MDPQLEKALQDRLLRLTEVGVALSAEQDLRVLLERILRVARRFTRADAGTLYLVEGDHLIFEIAHNDSLEDFATGTGGKLDIPPVPIDERSASGYVATTGKVLNIADVYAEEKYRFEGPTKYDRMIGYHTRSMLVVPMRDHEGQVIGVLQLINPLAPESGEIREFTHEEEMLIQSLASQAAMAINNVRLIDESRRLYRQNELILHAAGEGIFGLDLQGRFTFVNPAAANMFGCQAAELSGCSAREFCHFNGEEEISSQVEECRFLETCRAGEESRRMGERFWKRDGTSFPVDYVSTPIAEGGEVVGAVVVFQDISERQRIEEERRALELHLIQSERMASVGVVAAGIVHNLRNSLVGILNYAELLHEKDPGLADVGQIVASARDMNEMIEDILAKSRQNKRVEAVDLNDLVRRELDFLQADRVFKHRVAKDIRLAEEMPCLECVYTDFSQAVGNLLRNAVDAMRDREERRLTVTTRLASGEIVLEIGDTGCGIDESALPHLFEPFFTTKVGDGGEDAPVGTGLGLYMLKRLLDPYGVEVEVESEVDAGSTFRLRIPRGE